MDLNDHSESDDTNGDGEGVWSPDIEQCFREALLLFPPCGRRKHILQEEGGGKMYGRNELIARHIMMRTGKSRTRKQVSSHIQVLARRKAKAEAATPSTSSITNSIRPRSLQNARPGDQSQQAVTYSDIWADRFIATRKIRLVEFSAFVEHRDLRSQIQGTVLPYASSRNAPIDLNIGDEIDQIPMQQQYNLSSHQASNTPATSSISTTSSSATSAHPFASNHLLLANYESNDQPHEEKSHILENSSGSYSSNRHYPIESHQSPSSGFIRHSYLEIKYPSVTDQQLNKLERIDISYMQDKFPEICGPEGLYQRGPAEAFFLVKFWIDLNNDFEYNIDDQNSFLGFSCRYETVDALRDITCSTKVCSYGRQAVEKVEKIHGILNNVNGRYSFDIHRSPMCKFMIQFIQKLRQLPRISQMNSVLENFTVLQVVTSESTSEILLCLAFVFEIASREQNDESQYHVYKLTKD